MPISALALKEQPNLDGYCVVELVQLRSSSSQPIILSVESEHA
jgi:hypothetical protein